MKDIKLTEPQLRKLHKVAIYGKDGIRASDLEGDREVLEYLIRAFTEFGVIEVRRKYRGRKLVITPRGKKVLEQYYRSIRERLKDAQLKALFLIAERNGETPLTDVPSNIYGPLRRLRLVTTHSHFGNKYVKATELGKCVIKIYKNEKASSIEQYL